MAPFLLLLLFGMVEFGWLFAQNLDVRHGAREGARLAAVNYPDLLPPATGTPDGNRDLLVAAICARMQTPENAEVIITTNGDVGDPAIVTVNTPGETLTGFIDFLLPPSLVLTSTVEIRLEQPATYSQTSGAQACP